MPEKLMVFLMWFAFGMCLIAIINYSNNKKRLKLLDLDTLKGGFIDYRFKKFGY